MHDNFDDLFCYSDKFQYSKWSVSFIDIRNIYTYIKTKYIYFRFKSQNTLTEVFLLRNDNIYGGFSVEHKQVKYIIYKIYGWYIGIDKLDP